MVDIISYGFRIRLLILDLEDLGKSICESIQEGFSRAKVEVPRSASNAVPSEGDYRQRLERFHQ
ncbi:hypothetical protein IPA_01210 [Ignicoccus pacificus DSM 13166]|uniref:Uncharacterized protein n=1 Tax=Ignicoccus pacificus DSM 13166 TaxID=940294 RepID=A0A977KCE5_9CREN|nr:hypothetical protein IPA_01210 [Ignicoccus pacificus DSM 13166]